MVEKFDKVVWVDEDDIYEFEEGELQRSNKTGWKSDDGREFKTQEDAEAHELKCKRQKHKDNCVSSFYNDINLSSLPYGFAERGTGIENVSVYKGSLTNFLFKNEMNIMNLYNELEGEK